MDPLLRRRALIMAAVLLVLIALLIAVATFAPRPEATGPITAPSGTFWGIATHDEPGRLDEEVRADLAAVVSSAASDPGFRFTMVRKYTNWNQLIPTSWQRSQWSQGIEPSTALTIDSPMGGTVTFAQIASGAEDAQLRRQANSIARHAEQTGFHMVFTLEHEPERAEVIDPVNNDAGNYVAAFIHLHDLFESVFAADHVSPVTWVNTLEASTYAGAHGGPDVWTPPEETYDYVGVDGYERWPCWGRHLTFPQIFGPAEQFAARAGKPLFIGEVGVVEATDCGHREGDPQAKAEWIDAAHRQVLAWNRTPDAAPVAAILWSDVTALFLDRYKLDYHVDSSPAALAAFARGATDPALSATPKFDGTTPTG